MVRFDWLPVLVFAGDIESMPFVEALRQFQFRVGESAFTFFTSILLATTYGVSNSHEMARSFTSVLPSEMYVR